MRNSIGGAWLFSISITLMMFIIAYVSITISYSNAYQLKNDIVLVIEQYNGLNGNSAPKIIKRMSTKKISSSIDCAKDYDTSTYYDGTSHGGDRAPKLWAVTEYKGNGNWKSANTTLNETVHGYVCIYKYRAHSKGGELEKSFYAVTTSFGFDFPIIGNIFQYRVTGETAVINYPDDNGFDFGV